MYVELHLGAAPSATLREPRDFTALHVEVPRGAEEQELGDAARTLGIGQVEGEHVYLSLDGLRALAPPDEEWVDGFLGMVAYARSRGWVRGDTVRAHLVAREP